MLSKRETIVQVAFNKLSRNYLKLIKSKILSLGKELKFNSLVCKTFHLGQDNSFVFVDRVNPLPDDKF